MKRILYALPILLVLVGFAQADAVSSWSSYMGNVTGHIIRGTAADTLTIPPSVVSGAKWLVFEVYAESIVDSTPNLQALVDWRNSAISSSWTATSFATADAGDTIVPVDAYIVDTLTTQTALLPHYSTLWSMPGAQIRLRLVGKRASQAAKGVLVKIVVRK